MVDGFWPAQGAGAPATICEMACSRIGARVVHSGVLRTPLFRLVALGFAMLGSLSAPTLALAHGHVHEHLSRQHADGEGGDHEGDHHDDHHAPARDDRGEGASRVRSSADEHAHGHPAMDVAPGVRDLIRLPATAEAAALAPPPVTVRVTLHEVRAPARTDRILLARPDPERGPPPTLRAPPTC